MPKQFYKRLFALVTVAAVATACIRPPENTATATPTAAATTVAQSATEAPRFTHPTEITNPLYPVSLTGQAISLGMDGGEPARNEVTLLPGTKTIAWDGQQTETRVWQYVAYSHGQLVEIAYDYFAQADDGSVYYMGEDVSNYEDGQLVSHEGSWLAGKDGAPPALIMPAQPEVGQIFNPENLPGVVYETDEIQSLTEKTTTPDGPTDKGVLIKEILMDNSIEYKVNAANFGIVEEREEGAQSNLVLFNRTDATPGNVPEPLSTIEVQAEEIMDAAPEDNGETVATNVAAIAAAWQAFQPQTADDHVPQPFLDAFTATFDRLQEAATAKDAEGAMQAANDLSAALMDLYTVYRPATPVDLGRLDVLERQVGLDVAGDDFTAAADSLVKTNAVWERLKPVIVANQGADADASFEKSLAIQAEALSKQDGEALTAEAKNSLELVDVLEQLFE